MCSTNTVPFQAINIALVINHYGRVHRHDPIFFFVTCQVEGCSSTYKTFEGYKSHRRRHHKHVDLTFEPMEPRLIEGRLVRLAGKLQRGRQMMLRTNLKTDHVMRRLHT